MEALPKSYTGKEFVVVEVDAHWKEAYCYLWQHVVLYLMPTLALMTPQPYASGLEAEPAHSRRESAPDPNSNDLRRTAASNHIQSDDATHKGMEDSFANSVEQLILPSSRKCQTRCFPSPAQDTFETDILEHCFISASVDGDTDIVVDWNAPGVCNTYLYQFDKGYTDVSKSLEHAPSMASKADIWNVPSPLRTKTHDSRSRTTHAEADNISLIDRAVTPVSHNNGLVGVLILEPEAPPSALNHCEVCYQQLYTWQVSGKSIPFVCRHCAKMCIVMNRSVLNNEEPEEEMEDLTRAEQLMDPLNFARVKTVVGDNVFRGHVEEIVVGQITRERLYLIKYDDGDLQHMTADEVRKFEDLDTSDAENARYTPTDACTAVSPELFKHETNTSGPDIHSHQP